MVLGDINARIHGIFNAETNVLGPHLFGGGIARVLAPAGTVKYNQGRAAQIGNRYLSCALHKA